MTEFFTITTLCSIALCLWNMALFMRFRHHNLSRHFVGFLMLFTLPLAYNYAKLSGVTPPKLLEALSHSLLLLYGPYLYVLLRSIIKRPLTYYWPQFIPFGIVALFKTLSNGEGLSLLLTFAFMGHVTCYAALNIKLVIRYRRQFNIIFAQFPQASARWLTMLAAGLAALSIADLVLLGLFTQNIFLPVVFWQSVLLGFCIYIFALAYLTLESLPALVSSTHRTEATTSARAISTTPISKATAPITADSESVTPKTTAAQAEKKDHQRVNELSDLAASQLAQQLQQLMKQQQIFRQNTLCLDDLAKAMSISKHQLSELLNVHLGMSFYECLNHYRTEYVCTQLADPGYNAPINELAYEAGFNNKNSFYTAFKEKTQQTPSSYRKNQQLQQVLSAS